MIKAIETRYKGYRFRSRLEARWAVFFDACGYSWEYEPQGFDLGGVWYLPDFRLSGEDQNGDFNSFWIEVKPDGPLPETDALKIKGFSKLVSENWHETGPKGVKLCEGYGDFIVLSGPPTIGRLYPGALHSEKWMMDDSYRGRPSFWNNYSEYVGIFGAPEWVSKSPYEKARSARFEHGDRG